LGEMLDYQGSDVENEFPFEDLLHLRSWKVSGKLSQDSSGYESGQLNARQVVTLLRSGAYLTSSTIGASPSQSNIEV